LKRKGEEKRGGTPKPAMEMLCLFIPAGESTKKKKRKRG